MKILGVAGLGHDPSVGLLADGRIRMAVESEKVTRHKHEISICPTETIRFVLKNTGTSLSDVDYLTTNWRAGPLANWLYLKLTWRYLCRWCSPYNWVPTLLFLAGTHKPIGFQRLQEERLPPIVEVRHHLAHLGSCYTLSPYEEAAVAIIDGCGELECTSLYHCHGRKVRKLYSMDLPVDSLGHLYGMATIHLGYFMFGDEYKVMGLAAHGERNPRLAAFFEELIRLMPEGRYRVDRRLSGNYMYQNYIFPGHVRSIIGPPRRPDEDLTDFHRDFAYALQRRLEEAVVHVIRHLKQATGSRYLCLAGGVALNSVANGKVLEQVPFDEIFVQPASHDGGTSLGSAAYFHYHVLKQDRPGPFTSASLGPSYSDESIRAELLRVACPHRRLEDPAAAAAELLAAGKVIGWFQGAAEFGPRALGNRSILADPRDAAMKDRLNRCVKEREGYRPFAPAILDEEMGRYFEHVRCSPYMLMVGRVRPERQAEIPAVVHVDGTARPQSVDARTNPLFHRLIEEFRRRTGVPVVVNTSFNVAGEPIVLRPVDAIRCFFGCNLDALVIGSFLVEKPPPSA
jgi:carbamoyltransferase